MDNNFPLNRFNFSSLIEYIRTVEELPGVITDGETGIEFYGTGAISRDELVDLLENFNFLDNLAQTDAQQEYLQHKQLGMKCFQFEPSWVEIDNGKVTVGYVGIYINTDFNLRFSKVGNEWVLIK